MPYVSKSAPGLVAVHRMLIQGPPNSGKTHSVCATWPRPLHIVVAPGEVGDATIPRGVEGIYPYVWEEQQTGIKTSSQDTLAQVETLMWEIIGGKYGPVESLCFDGFHKHYGYILDWISGGALFKGEALGSSEDPYASARMYNRAREYARYFVQRVNRSLIPNVVWICWDGREADDPTKGFKSQSHVFPGLPGQAAKEFMGEFSLTVHARILWAQRQPKGLAPAKWQLLPEGDVWGAVVKAPAAVIAELPVYCDQSYKVLKQVLEAAYAKAQAKP